MGKSSRLTISDLVGIFGVSAMTIWNWRIGSTRIKPLRCHFQPIAGGGKHRVYFLRGDVKRWCKANQIPIPPELVD